MSHVFSKIFSVLFIIGLTSCKNENDSDKYQIYNTILKQKVDTYGIRWKYPKLDKNYSEQELQVISKNEKDSLLSTNTLQYFVENKLLVLDTLNPSGEQISNNFVVTFNPKISKNTLDYSKIQPLQGIKRVDKRMPIDDNKNYTYLGDYSFSEPLFLNKKSAVLLFNHYCGSKCGKGLLIKLKKENGHWIIINEEMIWIS